MADPLSLPTATRVGAVPEVAHEQSFHLARFAGRAALLGEIDAWIERTRAGALVLTGGPGVGKSALAAMIAARHRALVHMVKSHPGPERFLRSLISQAAALDGAELSQAELDGDIDDLRNTLVGRLEALGRERGRVVLVLDALDELEDEAHVRALPAYAPAGVRFVLTSRPDHGVMKALRSRLASLDEMPVPPLTEAEIASAIGMRAAAPSAVDANSSSHRRARAARCARSGCARA